MINERHVVLVGPTMSAGMALLDVLWQADIEMAAEVVPFDALPRLLQVVLPRVLVLTDWPLETVQPLAIVVQEAAGMHQATRQPPDVAFIHRQLPPDLPPSWTWMTLALFPTWVRGLLGNDE